MPRLSTSLPTWTPRCSHPARACCAGLNKGVAIARFCEHLGIEREETLALGDSESDFNMADHVGTFCLVENGLTSAGAPEFLDTCDNAYVTRGKIVDGWAATAELLVAARS